MEIMNQKVIVKNKNVYERIKQINQEFKTVNTLNTSIAYLLIFKELKKIKGETNITLLSVSQISGVSYNRLRKISALYKANNKILEKIQLFNDTKGKEGVSAGVICRILKRKGLLRSKIIEKAETEKWNTSDVDDYFVELNKQKEFFIEKQQKNNNSTISKKDKIHVLQKVSKKILADKLIKNNNSIINNVKQLTERIDDIEENRGISFISLMNYLSELQITLHKFNVKVNNNCYKCNNCSFIFFAQIKTRKKKCSDCGSYDIKKIRLDGK